ncbi:hypothetical protein SAMN06265360_106120 [Haloechinothrix alba]|uniref:Uncharacterized protein n=1 Tax=Haloechinothrix alba TaxID=664784 RepID=A0A238WFT5_9PSEU|nr:hypothetical protein SAMN06265360_106120 [Haloechinothrix alba]
MRRILSGPCVMMIVVGYGDRLARLGLWCRAVVVAGDGAGGRHARGAG